MEDSGIVALYLARDERGRGGDGGEIRAGGAMRCPIKFSAAGRTPRSASMIPM